MYGAFSESKTSSTNTYTKEDKARNLENKSITQDSSINEITTQAKDNGPITQAECVDKNATCTITSEEVC